jgi:hypothetical protein
LPRVKFKLILLAAIPIFALLCAYISYSNAQWMVDAIQQHGFSPWPGGPDEDELLFWRQVPEHSFDLIEADQPGIGAGVIIFGFACWMALLGYLTRSTPIPYIVCAASLCMSLLCTGGPRAHRQVPKGFIVDAAARKITDDSGAVTPLCDVTQFALEIRGAAKGGPSYWIVAHFNNRKSEDLYVFDTEPPADYLLAQIRALRANAACAT